jgi:hypothetical protein
MSYEAHVTMLINCFTVFVYAYTVLELVTVSLMMVQSVANIVKPTDFFSMLFNIWFGMMTLAIVIVTRNLFKTLFCAEAIKTKLNQPVYTTTTLMPDGSAIKGSFYEADYRMFDLLSMLIKHSSAVESSDITPDSNPTNAKSESLVTPIQCSGTSDSQAESESGSYPNPANAEAESRVLCPGTPDSQAETETGSGVEYVEMAKPTEIGKSTKMTKAARAAKAAKP